MGLQLLCHLKKINKNNFKQIFDGGDGEHLKLWPQVH